MSDVDFLPTHDPLLRNPRLAHAAQFAVLGIQTQFESNSAYVIAVVEESFGAWRGVNGGSDDVATVRIVVHDGREDVTTPPRHMSTADGRLIVHTMGSMAVVDPSRRESIAYVTTDFAAARAQFRTTLEAITFALLAAFDRHPLHAAAIVRDGHALLLAAPSGTGKSTLAYAAHEAGLHVMSDDRVWVQLAPQLRIWGHTTAIALLPDAAAHFARDAVIAVGARGKRVFGLQNASAPRMETAERATVCILTKGSVASLQPLDADEAQRELTAQLAPGFDRFPERQDTVLRALTAHGGWRLTLSDNPRDALSFLLHMLGTP